MEKLQRIYDFASDYGIGVVKIRYDEMPRGTSKLDGGLGFHRRRLEVYVAHPKKLETAPLLHELAHIICQPPWCDVSVTCEAWLQVPFEYCVVRALRLSLRSYYNYLNTATMLHYKTLWEFIPLSMRRNILQQGRERAQRIGLLDEAYRPTYRWPNWRKLTKHDRDEFSQHRPIQEYLTLKAEKERRLIELAKQQIIAATEGT
jgi:hypothetical protein